MNFEKNFILNYFINQNRIFIFQYSLIISPFIILIMNIDRNNKWKEKRIYIYIKSKYIYINFAKKKSKYFISLKKFSFFLL